MSWTQAALGSAIAFVGFVAVSCVVEALLRERRRRQYRIPDSPWMKDCKRNGPRAPGSYH